MNLNKEEKQQLKLALNKRVDYWTGQLKEVEYLRRPGGNWSPMQEDQNAPKVVKGYIKARKKRENKIKWRLKNIFRKLEEL